MKPIKNNKALQLKDLLNCIKDKNVRTTAQDVMETLHLITKHNNSYKYLLNSTYNTTEYSVNKNYLKTLDKIKDSILATYVNVEIPKNDKFFIIKERYRGNATKDTLFLGREFKAITMSDVRKVLLIQQLSA